MTGEEIDRKLAAGIRWGFAGLAFLLPLLVSTRSSEVFELPKIMFVYAATAVIVGLWLGRMLARREILIRRTPLDIPILLFLISQMASTIYSIDPAVSWWGWYGRFQGGLWSTISYTLLYYAFVTNFVDQNKESPWRMPRRLLNTIINTIIASATVVGLYAIFQHFGIDKNFWVQDVVNRVFSTQGQPNWLAGYIVMTMPLAFAITSSKFKVQSSKLFSYGIIVVLFLALLWTKSRSGLLGLAGADLVFWLLIFFRFYLLKKTSYIDRQRSLRQQPTFSAVKKLYRLPTIVHNLYNFVVRDKDREKVGLVNLTKPPLKPFILIHILMTGLILTTDNPTREWMAGKLPVTSDKLQVTSGAAMENGITLRKSEHGGTESGDIRRIVWSGAVELVKQRPIFGFGPETFGETYWRVRLKEHNLTSEWNFLYNKAHNEWLNLAANTGIFGLGSHLLLLTWFSVWALRSFANFSRVEKFAKLNYLTTAILAAIVGVEAVNFFGFSTVTTGTYQYLFMGLAVSSSLRGVKKNFRDNPSRSILQGLSLVAIAIGVLYILSRLFIFFLADLAYNRGRAYQDGGYVEEAVEPLMQAVNLAPGEPVFRAELGEAEGIMASQVQSSKFKVQSEDQTLINELRNEAIKNLETVRKQSPYNLGFIRTEARVLFLLGEHDRALQLMKAAMEIAPTNPQLPYSLGVMLSKMGEVEEAAVYYNKAKELKPDYPIAIPISE